MTDQDHSGIGDSQVGNPPGTRPHHDEQVLHTEKIQIERKVFVFSLRENSRGRFVRITEDVGGRRDAIIVPAPGLQEFRQALDRLTENAAEIPLPPPAV